MTAFADLPLVLPGQRSLFGDALAGARYRLDCADAVAWLRGLEPASVDLLITDIAYESLEKHRKVGTTTRLQRWFDIFPNERIPELMAAAYRVLRRNTHFYFFCDAETMFIAKPAGEAAGFTFWKPLVWDKKRIGMGYHYRARCEFILFFEKGERQLNDLGVADVLGAKSVRNAYPTEKPVQISDVLVTQSSASGEIVADPFLGSGSVGEAALRRGRRFLGCDLSAEAVTAAESRLAGIAA